jgi:hypothetical protein
LDFDPTVEMLVGLVCATGVNIQHDAMVRERKDRRVRRTLVYRSFLQRRQNPHAAPTMMGLLKQNPVWLNEERVTFG